MLKTRRRRLDQQGARAMQRLAAIEASIKALSNDDLLDLADIFNVEPRTPLGEIAFATMAQRGISL